jgi:hypothetical protein
MCRVVITRTEQQQEDNMTAATAQITALAAEIDQLEKLASPNGHQDRRYGAILDQLRQDGIDVAAWQDKAADAIAREVRMVTMVRFVTQATATPAPVAAPAPRPTIAEQIAAAYAALAPEPGAWVGLAAIRQLVGCDDKAEVDAVLTRMERLPNVFIVVETAQFDLTPEDRAAAVRIGGRDKHNLKIEAPSAWA